MKYMFLIYSDETCWTEESRQACMIESMAICDELAANGKFIAASPLEYVSSAVSVRVRSGRTQITTGPFAETTEQLGGFYLLELDNLDEAISVASRLPPAKSGTVEIRPILHLSGLPAERFELSRQDDGSLRAYILLCYDDEDYWRSVGSESHHAAMEEAVSITHELDAHGQFISASPLHPIATATSVRIRNGQRLVSDGPFAETREVLGGYYLILAPNQQEAASVAARHPGNCVGTVEVRPLYDMSKLPKSLKCESNVVDWTAFHSTR